MRGTTQVVVLTCVLLAAACTSQRQPQAVGTASVDPSAGGSVCPPPVTLPQPYAFVETTALEGATPAASSTLYQGPNGTKVVLQSGLLGDFFDDSYEEELPMAGGGSGYLFARGDRSWGFMWTEPAACHQNTVSGSPFRRPAFVDLLRQAGLLTE